MKIVLAGPSETSALRSSLGLRLEGAPPGSHQTPIAPLAGALRKRGLTVHIIQTDPSVEQPVLIEEDGCAVEYIPVRGAPRYRARVRASDLFEVEIEAMRAALARAKPDVVHAHWTYEFAEAAVRSGLPHVVTMHDIGWQNVVLYRDLYRLMRLVMMLRVMPRIQCLAVVAPFMHKWARWHGYFGTVAVIPNGIELPAGEQRAHKILDRRPLRIVSIGDPTRRKNIVASLAAFRLVRTRFPDAELHLFGAGLDERYAQGELGVFPHGKVSHPELMQFLAEEATLLVHPSLQETFGVIVAEAMVRGVPVVAGENAGGLSYVADNGRVARLVDVSSPESIAGAVTGLLTDRQACEIMCSAAADHVTSTFGIDAVCDQYISIYNRLAGA